MIVVKGYSDDIIFVDGDIGEEFTFMSKDDDEDHRFLAFSDGTVLKVRYDGCWRITVEATPSRDSFTFVPAIGEDSEQHSDIVTLHNDIRWVVYGTEFQKPRGKKVL